MNQFVAAKPKPPRAPIDLDQLSETGETPKFVRAEAEQPKAMDELDVLAEVARTLSTVAPGARRRILSILYALMS